MDRRQGAAYAVIGVFMMVTVGHVAAYCGSMEPQGWAWLGWPYALAVDGSIAVCAWLTRWETTKSWAWVGYFAFTAASGALNVAQVRPWAQEAALGAWVYAFFPTLAIALLGFLARDASKFRKRSKSSDGSGTDQAAPVPATASQGVVVCEACGKVCQSQNALNAHRRWCAGVLVNEEARGDDESRLAG